MLGLQFNTFENNDSEIALVDLFPLYVFKDQSDSLRMVFLEKQKYYGPRLGRLKNRNYNQVLQSTYLICS